MSKFTRRSFLEQTLLTASAAVAATRFSPNVEADEATPKPAAGSPSERVGVAVVGLHNRGLVHVDSYSYDDSVDVVALCDVDDAMFGPAQKKLQERGRKPARQYTDIRKLLEDKDVQALSIATPNHWHTLAGIWGMQAGRDVYVEKPVGHNISEGRRLEQARVKYNRICAAGTQWRSNRAVQAAMEFMHSGKLGKISLSRGLCYKARPSIGHFDDSAVPPGVDYDIWLGPAPVRPFNKNRFLYNWHWNWAYGNGDLGNQGIHQMDLARFAIQQGMAPGVLSLGGRFGYKDDGETPNTQLCLYDYGSDAPQLLFEVRGLKTQPLMGVKIGNIIYGSEGMITIAETAVLQLDPKGKVVQKFKGGSSNHFGNFISAVRSRRQEDLRAPIVEGHLSSGLCHLGNISYRLGQPQPFDAIEKMLGDKMNMDEAYKRFQDHLTQNSVNLKEISCQFGPTLAFDPKAEDFGSNAAANAFLTREYRPPFVVPTTL